MTDYLVCDESDIAEGGRRVVQCGQHEIGIFRIKGQLHAWHNICPHRQGPICQGHIYARVIEPVDERGQVRLLQYDEGDQHVVCPWHGYEFNLETGRCNGNDRMKLFRAEIAIRDGAIHVIV
ncbi:Rieske (2Fe-2S) protein [Rhodobacter sp. NTK016B]|uniref:Rieske (2Fe-2S) protein n=1 Tax=Rhodobacter sp. NTK016B TaxID=2759676 RepID=UPI001A8DD477|nr:Rieske (2Fe-2S) protein [Rhodobacter sp. NTK016B]MBN8293268.1 Rieske (2Fe-2S) protein [Rhodobacter sp. NTK016B]